MQDKEQPEIYFIKFAKINKFIGLLTIGVRARKMVLIVVFGTNKNEITGGWKELSYEVLYNFHS
jgi:hypothetical protein